MRNWIRALDAVLRGDATRPDRLRAGRFDVPIGGLTVLVALLGAGYGLCMGVYGIANRPDPQPMQMLAAAVKVPALFLLTLLVTLPSLYVFNALMGSRLGGAAVLRLLVAALGVTLAVLASLGPIVAFFSVTTASYPFMKLLNVAVFAASGALGLRFLVKTLAGLTAAGRVPVQPILDDDQEPDVYAARPARPDAPARGVFAAWVVVFALVGAQMSWVLRPFIGDPDRPFEWFRPRESNFFESVRRTVAMLLWE